MVHPSIWSNSIVLFGFLFELVRDVQSETEVLTDRHETLVQKPVLLTPCHAHLAGYPWDKGDEFSSVSLDLHPYSSEDKWALCIVGRFVLWFWWKLKINGKQCSEATTTERPSFLFPWVVFKPERCHCIEWKTTTFTYFWITLKTLITSCVRDKLCCMGLSIS